MKNRYNNSFINDPVVLYTYVLFRACFSKRLSREIIVMKIKLS